MRPSRLSVVALLALAAACASRSGVLPETLGLRTWGELKEVLRLGRTEGRVTVSEVLTRASFGVGLLEGLDGELTIDAGVAHVASVADGELVQRELAPEDRATLLAIADVPAWTALELPALADLRALERALPELIPRAGLDPHGEALPLRIEGHFESLDLHVLDHSCPMANPDGPPPWRLTGAAADGVVVGFYAEEQGGRLTHHGDTLHLHAIVTTADGRRVSGHVDELRAAAGLALELPARWE